jgi:tripartite-type tricarboxylate transporter receptor subunit TctC
MADRSCRGASSILFATLLYVSAACAESPAYPVRPVPGYHSASWAGIVAPRGTPRAIINTVNADLHWVLAENDLRQRLTAQGYDPEPGTPQQFADYIRSEFVRYAKLVTAAGIALE